LLGHKYRIEFSKLGSLSFISHLDMQKIMARIFKRAEIEMLHSEGYKTRPLISFGPALTLGISSLTEFFDVRVPKEWENPKEVLKLLQKHSEKGIVFKNIELITTQMPSIQDATKEFKYFIPLEDEDNVNSAMEKINTSDEIIVESYSKKRQMDIKKNIKNKILNVEAGKLEFDEELMDVIDEVSPCRNQGLFITTEVDQGSSVRPKELVESLTAMGYRPLKPIKIGVSLH
jgi:radical SAM-linked protein